MNLVPSNEAKYEAEWQEIRSKYLPHTPPNSIWSYSQSDPSLPPEGWKIHISANLLTAVNTFKAVIEDLLPYHFKSVRSLNELKKLNCGLFYGYSQIGKFITVYVPTNKQLIIALDRLKKTSKDLFGPSVPSDIRVPSSGCLFFRYGSYKSNSDGIGTINGPNGEPVLDKRERDFAIPSWIPCPIETGSENCFNALPDSNEAKLSIRYKIYEAMSQRGKGGVYRAVDLGVKPAQLVVIKEGRNGGEIDWAGRDGKYRIKKEAEVLHHLHHLGVRVPKILDTFDYPTASYLVIEQIEGLNLHRQLSHRKKYPIDILFFIAKKICLELKALHDNDICWRDLKPLNLMFTKDKEVVLLDFEGAIIGKEIVNDPWGSIGYIPPEWLNATTLVDRKAQDLFSLGATLYQLFTKKIPTNETLVSMIYDKHNKLPFRIKKMIGLLMDNEPANRPNLNEVITLF